MADPFEIPQDAGYQTILFNGSVTDSSALALVGQIFAAKERGKTGVWVGIQSGGGVPGAARLVHSHLAPLGMPAISDIHEVFSEGASHAAAFPKRSISPVGKVGFHQSAMNLAAESYPEDKSLTSSSRSEGTTEPWWNTCTRASSFAGTRWGPGMVFIGQEAVAPGVVPPRGGSAAPAPL